MYNFNSIEKVIKNIGKSKFTPNQQLSKTQISPFCMGATCQMISSSSHIPIIGINNPILPLKEECPHYLSNNNYLYSESAKAYNKNNNFIPKNRLYSTSFNNNNINNNINNNNNNNSILLLNNTKKNKLKTKHTQTIRRLSTTSPPTYTDKDDITEATTTTTTTTTKTTGGPISNKACSVTGHCSISETSEEYQNCVKFETNKSNYVHEIIEGILPKELVSGSRMIAPNEPHCIFVNFSSAVKAYQADQYIRQWSEKNLPSLKSVLIKNSLDPIYSINSSSIDKVYIGTIYTSSLNNNNKTTSNYNDNNEFELDINLPEYPIPNFNFINNELDCNEYINSMLLNGKPIESINNQDGFVFSFDLEYVHKDNLPNTFHFFVLTLSNGKNNLIFNLDSLNGTPKLVSDIFKSPYIKKVGFTHHKYHITDFEQQFNIEINNYDDLSKNPIILHSSPKTLVSTVAIFLKNKLPRIEVNRFAQNTNHNFENGLFSLKKLQHYAQLSDSIYSLNRSIHQYSPPFYY